jgi:hypothetical protein
MEDQSMDKPKELPDLVVTRDGVPFKDQAEGVRQFKAACVAPSRQVLFHEIAPGHWVSISMGGPFDSDMWHVLHDFVKRHETRPIAHSGEGQHG